MSAERQQVAKAWSAYEAAERTVKEIEVRGGSGSRAHDRAKQIAEDCYANYNAVKAGWA